jgi:hypothetical protein
MEINSCLNNIFSLLSTFAITFGNAILKIQVGGELKKNKHDAGNRCFNENLPEETNKRIVDCIFRFIWTVNPEASGHKSGNIKTGIPEQVFG